MGLETGGLEVDVMSLRQKIWSTLLLLVLVTQAQAATTTVEMLRDMFRRPVTEWREVLKSNRALLDQQFFSNVEKRIRWGIENNHIDDAFRFAMVGDFGSEAKSKPANFRIDLAELFFNAENFVMAGQIVDNIMVTSPDTPAAKRAAFLRARLFEMQKNLFQAHAAYVELARQGYKPEEAWHKAGLISMLIHEESRGLEELKRAKEAGSVAAGIDYDKFKSQLTGDWVESFPAAANTSGTTNEGLVNTSKGPDKGELLTEAKSAVLAGNLDVGRAKYQEAYNLDNNNPEIFRGLAAVLYRQGALGEAKAFLDKVITQDQNDPELYRFRGNVLERMYDRDKNQQNLAAAVADYEKALSLSPNHQFLQTEYQRAKGKK